MNGEFVFSVVFVLQIYFVSLGLPFALVSAANGRAGAEELAGVGRRYSMANTVVAAGGFGVLAFVLRQDPGLDMSSILLTIGAYFFVQLMPLALAQRGGLTGGELGEGESSTPALPPWLVGAALLLLVVVLLGLLWAWNGEWNAQLLKVVALVGANGVLGALVVVRLWAARGPDDARSSDPARAVAVLLFTSMGLSVYFLLKEVLFAADLHELRPAMMSLFLVALAGVVFAAMKRSEAPAQAV